MEKVSDYKEIAQIIKEKGGDAFKLCYQCGKCDVVCPWNRVKKFSMRKLVREAAFGMSEIEGEDIWQCSTCGKCPMECPRNVKQVESGIAIRRIATDYGVYSPTANPIRAIRSNLSSEGNPFQEDRKKRADWANGLGVNSFTEGMEILYYPGCYLSYDPRLKKVAVATAKILQKANVNFGILGAKEVCCGESIRKTGDEQLFRKLAKENINTFIDNGVKKILVSSPHCFTTFKKEYPEFMVNFEVVHITQFVSELLEQGRLKINGNYNKTVTYHDPCYLGRHNGIYEQPRTILQSINSLTFVEMIDNKKDSLCCGGGGGRIWMDTPKGERFADLRLLQALDAGANVLATSCPYCIANFEDSKLSNNKCENLEIKDITEIISEAIL